MLNPIQKHNPKVFGLKRKCAEYVEKEEICEKRCLWIVLWKSHNGLRRFSLFNDFPSWNPKSTFVFRTQRHCLLLPPLPSPYPPYLLLFLKFSRNIALIEKTYLFRLTNAYIVRESIDYLSLSETAWKPNTYLTLRKLIFLDFGNLKKICLRFRKEPLSIWKDFFFSFYGLIFLILRVSPYIFFFLLFAFYIYPLFRRTVYRFFFCVAHLSCGCT